MNAATLIQFPAGYQTLESRHEFRTSSDCIRATASILGEADLIGPQTLEESILEAFVPEFFNEMQGIKVDPISGAYSDANVPPTLEPTLPLLKIWKYNEVVYVYDFGLVAFMRDNVLTRFVELF